MNARMLIVLAVAMAAAAIARGQDALALARTLRVEPGTPITLGDIAEITGPSAESLASLVLIEDPSAEPADARGWFRVELDRVATLLTDTLGEPAGMIALTGSACDILVRRAAPPQADPAQPEQPKPAAPDATELVTLNTTCGAVARELARLLRAEPGALRLEFDPADDEFLNLPLAGFILEISPAGASERLPVVVTRYDANGRANRRTIRVAVEVRRPVAIAARVISRGEHIEPADITTEARWSSPTDQLVAPSSAIGAVARRKLDPGEPLQPHHVEPPVLVHRNDEVNVRVFCNGLIVARVGQALTDAREGETITFAAKDNPRQRFRATVVGPGQATAATPRTLLPISGTAVASGPDAG